MITGTLLLLFSCAFRLQLSDFPFSSKKKERKEEIKLKREREKSSKFWAPTLRAPPFGPHPEGGPPFGAPCFWVRPSGALLCGPSLLLCVVLLCCAVPNLKNTNFCLAKLKEKGSRAREEGGASRRGGLREGGEGGGGGFEGLRHPSNLRCLFRHHEAPLRPFNPSPLLSLLRCPFRSLLP